MTFTCSWVPGFHRQLYLSSWLSCSSVPDFDRQLYLSSWLTCSAVPDSYRQLYFSSWLSWSSVPDSYRQLYLSSWLTCSSVPDSYRQLYLSSWLSHAAQFLTFTGNCNHSPTTWSSTSPQPKLKNLTLFDNTHRIQRWMMYVIVPENTKKKNFANKPTTLRALSSWLLTCNSWLVCSRLVKEGLMTIMQPTVSFDKVWPKLTHTHTKITHTHLCFWFVVSIINLMLPLLTRYFHLEQPQ